MFFRIFSGKIEILSDFDKIGRTKLKSLNYNNDTIPDASEDSSGGSGKSFRGLRKPFPNLPKGHLETAEKTFRSYRKGISMPVNASMVLRITRHWFRDNIFSR